MGDIATVCFNYWRALQHCPAGTIACIQPAASSMPRGPLWTRNNSPNTMSLQSAEPPQHSPPPQPSTWRCLSTASTCSLPAVSSSSSA